MYTRNLLWLVSLVSAAPLYAADVPANTPLAPQQVFRYNNHSDPGTLDPQKVEENTAAQIVLDLFEGLVWMDGEGQVQPAQAERWEILDGGKRYIFHLRSGLQWSDGQPLTAEDFVLGWQRAVDPKTASPFAGYLAQYPKPAMPACRFASSGTTPRRDKGSAGRSGCAETHRRNPPVSSERSGEPARRCRGGR